jgi:type III pantothenate kinase
MNLLLDLGNTRLKWAWHDGDALGARGALAHGEGDWLAQLQRAWRGGVAPEHVWLAVVGPEPVAAAVESVLASIWPEAALHRVISPAAGAGVVNAYAQPARLGVDRFLAMIGARGMLDTAVVVAGCGTALAIDLLDAEGRHHGGVIAPSPPRMREAVLHSTARVNAQPVTVPGELGRSTEAGLESGCWLAAAALIDRIVDDAALQLGDLPQLLLHGGDAERIATLLRHRASLAPDLVLAGLGRWSMLHGV